jgi:XTP/dITP diphosphohydrolase/tetrapyrrole methylase family protein/MazG family protein/ATP diphosphatase
MAVTIVGLGPGDPDGVPLSAIRALAGREHVYAIALDTALASALDRVPTAVADVGSVPDGGLLVADDLSAHALALAHPDAATVPDRPVLRNRAIGAAVAGLAQVGSHLRRECPWDRVQTAATIVPHTVEEAFEVAEAVATGDVARQADEIGDLLFQSVFLAQLLEESGDPDLAAIAEAHARKLIARHPHVYGEAVAETAGGVRDLWERQKREARDDGIFHELPPGLPALAYATKAQRRAASVGFEFAAADAALVKLDEEVAELHADPGLDELGDVLFACVAVARSLKVDPEIAVRAAAQRFRERVEHAAELAQADGLRFEDLDPQSQLRWYAEAKQAGHRTD